MSGHVTALRYISFLSISAIVFLTLVVAAKTPGHFSEATDQWDTVKYSLWTVRAVGMVVQVTESRDNI